MAQTRWVSAWHHTDPKKFPRDFLGLLARQHAQNFRLWHLEDHTRDTQASDAEIARAKRKIDVLNQERNDLTEKIDDYLFCALREQRIAMNPKAPLNSETPGSMIDRCSIMALKIYHMQEEVLRVSSEQQKKRATRRLKILLQQRTDLISCLSSLMREVRLGRRRFKRYRQFKMYNDPL